MEATGLPGVESVGGDWGDDEVLAVPEDLPKGKDLLDEEAVGVLEVLVVDDLGAVELEELVVGLPELAQLGGVKDQGRLAGIGGRRGSG